MNSNLYPKDFKAQQELKSCGFTPESINAIQSTKVITRDGAQHIVPGSQAYLDQQKAQSTQSPPTTVTSSGDADLLVQLQEQKMLFSRHKNYTDQRLMKLETAFCAAHQKMS